MFLIVGLGNPGPRYEDTRHNLGYRLVERLAERAGGGFKLRACRSAICEIRHHDERLVLAQPLTYMNSSGGAVLALLGRYGVEPERLLIVYDEAALPLGRIRLRPSGSSGGQKGMQSVLDALGRQDVPRLRLGVGGKRGYDDLIDYVLSEFEPHEQEAVAWTLDRAVEACDFWMDSGIEAAMSQVNALRMPESDPED